MTLVTTPFGPSSTADDVLVGVDLAGRRVVVTGGASGIGLATAQALARAGADVTVAVRDVAAGEAATADARHAGSGGGRVRVARLDLLDLTSVVAFAEAWDGPLDALVANAAVMACPEQRTADGWELQFATNHLGHFALALGLRRALAAACDARVVAVSSTAHRMSPVVFGDIHFTARPYDGWLGYAQSKTANILTAVGITRRWAADGVTANALNPGIVLTPLLRHVGPLDLPPGVAKTPEQGAATSVLLAASPLVAGVGGRYFHDGNEAGVAGPYGGRRAGVAAYAVDAATSDRLWDESVRMLAASRSTDVRRVLTAALD